VRELQSQQRDGSMRDNGLSSGEAETELAEALLRRWMDRNEKVPRRVVLLLHDVKADDASFDRARDAIVGAFDRACERLTAYIVGMCPPDAHGRGPVDNPALIEDGQPVIEPGSRFWRPKIVALAQSRSDVRMYPRDRDSARDKRDNVPAGTAMFEYVPIRADQTRDKDAFLITPQAGLMGTKKVSAYHVLRNDPPAVPLRETLCPLVNTLSHCYARCPRAVSLPSPIAYALRVYERLIGALRMDDGASQRGGGGGGGGDATSAVSGESVEEAFPLQPRHENLDLDCMYYV
jgi:hypothetical protein